MRGVLGEGCTSPPRWSLEQEKSFGETKCEQRSQDEEQKGRVTQGGCRVAAVLAVTRAGFDEDVVGARPHQAVVLVVGAFAWGAEEGAGPDEPPVAVHCRANKANVRTGMFSFYFFLFSFG